VLGAACMVVPLVAAWLYRRTAAASGVERPRTSG